MDIKDMPLVSVITACFNEAVYLEELLRSILNQTYKKIELIFMDDGSTDNTKDIIREYTEIFSRGGMALRYIYQDNAGQTAATNRALKMISGKYLCWIDGDDFLYQNAVEKKVDFLEKHPDYGMVTSDFYLLYQDGRKERKGELYKTLNWQTDQFALTIAGESIIENLAHMINVELFRRINPELNIVECLEGQNYQILLPLLYFYKRGYIDEPLGCYRIHEDSHSRKKRTHEDRLLRFDRLTDMLDEVLKSIGIEDREKIHLIRNSTFYMEKGRYIDNGRIVQMVGK